MKFSFALIFSLVCSYSFAEESILIVDPATVRVTVEDNHRIFMARWAVKISPKGYGDFIICPGKYQFIANKVKSSLEEKLSRAIAQNKMVAVLDIATTEYDICDKAIMPTNLSNF